MIKRRIIKNNKKKKGFTLIELLAVILILGIIALIAIPTVNGVIEQSRKGAAESNASQFVNSVEELIMISELNKDRLEDGLYEVNELQNKGLNVKGTMPDSGFVQIERQEVIDFNLKYGNYKVTLSNDKPVVSNDDINFVLKEDNDGNKEISVGDKVCLDTECFYVISNYDEDVRLLAEWNLNVGYELSQNGSNRIKPPLKNSVYDKEKATFIWNADYKEITPNNSLIRQEEDAKGYLFLLSDNTLKLNGVTHYTKMINESFDGYWTDNSGNLKSKYGSSYPAYVYDENTFIYNYINSYVNNLKLMSGLNIKSGELIRYDDLVNLQCDMSKYSCSKAKKWLYQTSYWTGSAKDSENIWVVQNYGYGSVYDYYFYYIDFFGVRPVITITKDLIKK